MNTWRLISGSCKEKEIYQDHLWVSLNTRTHPSLGQLTPMFRLSNGVFRLYVYIYIYIYIYTHTHINHIWVHATFHRSSNFVGLYINTMWMFRKLLGVAKNKNLKLLWSFFNCFGVFNLKWKFAISNASR